MQTEITSTKKSRLIFTAKKKYKKMSSKKSRLRFTGKLRNSDQENKHYVRKPA